MSQIELAVTLSRKLESLLEAKYQATGKGLHEKVSSVEGKLPEALVKNLRYIATMRNSVVHQDGFVIEDLAGFSAQGDAALAQLGGTALSAPTRGDQLRWLLAHVGLAFIVLSGLIGAYALWRSSHSVGGALGGLIGGAVIGAWVLSWLRSALEFILGLVLIGAAIAVVVAIVQWAHAT